MADELQTEGSAENQAQAPSAGTQNTDSNAEHMIPKSRFDELNREFKALKAKLDAEDKAREAAEAQRLKEAGEWKALAERAQADAERAQAQAKALELAMLRKDIATKVGLPAVLIDRLQGDTPETIEADAKALIESLPKPTVNGVPPTPQPRGASDAVRDEDAKKRFALNYQSF